MGDHAFRAAEHFDHLAEAPLVVEYKEKGQTVSSSNTGHHEGIGRKLVHLGCEDSLKLRNVSLLQRVDLLDNILSTMEDKVPVMNNESHLTSPKATRKHSSAPSTPSALEKRCKPAEFVLEEVEEKGTLVERISDLEKRVLKLQRILSATSSQHDNAAVVPQPPVAALADVSSAQSTPPHDQVIDVEVVQAAMIHAEPCLCGIDPREREAQNGGSNEETSPSEGEAASANHQPWKQKKSTKLKKWLSKRLHIHFPATRQKNFHCVPHCWNPHIHKESCWNMKRGVPHPSYEDVHDEHDAGDECP